MRAAALALAICTAGAANAQPSIYTMRTEPAHLDERRQPSTVVPRPVGTVAAQRYMLAFGRCVLQRYPQYVPAFLAEVPTSAEAVRAGQRLGTEECVEDGMLRMNGVLLRGALYDAMYNGRGAMKLNAVAASVPQIDYRPARAAPGAAGLAAWMQLMTFADCATRADPTDVGRILGSTAGSPEETAAFTALAPSFGPCISKDAQIKFSRIMLRGLLAEVGYKLANPGAALASAGK